MCIYKYRHIKYKSIKRVAMRIGKFYILDFFTAVLETGASWNHGGTNQVP